MNKEIKEPAPPQATLKTVIIPKDPYCSCIVVSEDSIILSYTLYILILNIITHPITLHAKLREEKQCHIPDHLMYVHPFPPLLPILYQTSSAPVKYETKTNFLNHENRQLNSSSPTCSPTLNSRCSKTSLLCILKVLWVSLRVFFALQETVE